MAKEEGKKETLKCAEVFEIHKQFSGSFSAYLGSSIGEAFHY
jgi:hypothetical protein